MTQPKPDIIVRFDMAHLDLINDISALVHVWQYDKSDPMVRDDEWGYIDYPHCRLRFCGDKKKAHEAKI